uniref:Uncharacterized protein n=2 Tax=Saccharolobus islandicus TaxID=43080 RepID=Q0ZNV5_SACIS|nr:hypothetical protein [Sulfolobus islandicus]
MWILGLVILVLLLAELVPAYLNVNVNTQIEPIPTVTAPTQSITFSSPPVYQENYSTVYSKPDISTLEEIPANLLNNSVIEINGNSNLLTLLLKTLSLNASEISPENYQKFLQIASSLYSIIHGYSYVNINNTVIEIPFNVSYPTSFPNNWSYPPSDKLIVNSPVYRIINETSITTNVVLSINNYTYLLYKHTTTNGNVTNVYEYYAMDVQVVAYLYANNNLINLQYLSTTFYWNGGANSSIISGYVTVPPGVQEEVYGSYSIYTTPGFKKHTNVEGNITYNYYIYYPKGPYSTTVGYTFNWYEYNVTLPIQILVFNGTNPQTIVGNKIYNSRDFTAYFSYITWSSDPNANGTTIITSDYIRVANYSIERTWNAGSVEIIPQPIVQQNGNTINYVLTFNVQSDLIQPPSWIFEPIEENVTVEKDWFNFLNLIAFAHTLYKVLNYNLTAYDYYVSILTFYGGTNDSCYYKMYNDSLALFSIFSPWNITKGILNLAAGEWNSTWIYVMGSNLLNTIFYGLLDSNNNSWLIYDPDIVYATYYDENPIGFQFTTYPQENSTPPAVVLNPFPTSIIVKYGIYYYNPLPYSTFTYETQKIIFQYYYNSDIDRMITL